MRPATLPEGATRQALAETARDLVVRRRPGGAVYWVAVAILALLAAAGVVALVMLAQAGPLPRAKWGYAAATLAFLLSTAAAAPPLALASRLGRGHWGAPLRRAADLFALSNLVTAPLFVLLVWQLPPSGSGPSIWQGWPGAPQLWDAVAVCLLLLSGLALLWASTRPDRAVARALRGTGAARPLRGWWGAPRQWRVLSLSVTALGGVYLMLLVFVHLLLVSDLGMSLVPGWASANMPPYHAITALQAGIATTILTLWALRNLGLREYVGDAVFHACGKLLLALTLLWFYFTWSEFLTYWYGRMPSEQDLISLLFFGPNIGLFLAAALLNLILPFLLLLWNTVRESVWGPTLAALLVLLGNLVDRIRIYGVSWLEAVRVYGASGGQPAEAQLPGALIRAVPPPGLGDILILVGMPAAVLLLYLLALRLVPVISVWEYRERQLFTTRRPFGRTRVEVIAKPN